MVLFTIHYDERPELVTPENQFLFDHLQGILERLRSPAELSVWFVQLEKASLGDGRVAVLYVWKGGCSPRSKNRRLAGARMFIQWVRQTPLFAVVTPLGVLSHDDYDRDRWPSFPVRRDIEVTATEVEEEQLALGTAAKARILTPLVPPMVGPTVEHPLTVPTQEVRDLVHGLSAGRRHMTRSGYEIERTGSRYLIRAKLRPDRSDVEVTYPIKALDDGGATGVLDAHRRHPSTNPALKLSDAERDFLRGFGSGHHLPAIIDGSAGSGKTTILSSIMLDLVARHLQDTSSPAPLFVTFSRRLLETFRLRLKNGLVVFHGVDELSAETAASRTCFTLDDLVHRALGSMRPSSASPASAEDYQTFKRCWGPSATNSFEHGGSNLEDTYHTLRQLVLGRISLMEDGHFVWGSRKADVEDFLVAGGIPNNEQARLLKVLEMFGRYVARDGTELFSDKVHRATRRLVEHGAGENRGVVVIDEAQDLSGAELEFVLLHSTLTETAPLLARNGGDKVGYVPLIVAGDELQSVIPSGFSFQELRERIVSFAAVRGLDLDPGAIHQATLVENFRAATRLVEFGDAARRLRSSRATDSVALRKAAGDVYRLSSNAVPPAVDVVVIVPTLSALETSQPHGDEGLLELGDGWVAAPVDVVKGSEYPAVVLRGFGAALLEASARNSQVALEWLRNALSVAATRPRDALYINDTDLGFDHLCRELRSVGFELGDAKVMTQIELDELQKLELLEGEVERAIEDQSLDQLDRLGPLVRVLGDSGLLAKHSAWTSVLSGHGEVPWPEIHEQHVLVRDQLIEALWVRGLDRLLVGVQLEDFTRPGRVNSRTHAMAVVATLRHRDVDLDGLAHLTDALNQIRSERNWLEVTDDLDAEVRRWAAMPSGRVDDSGDEFVGWWRELADTAKQAGLAAVAETATMCGSTLENALIYLGESIHDPERREQLTQVAFQRSMWWLTTDEHSQLRQRIAGDPSSIWDMATICSTPDVVEATARRVNDLLHGGHLEQLAITTMLERRTHRAVTELNDLLATTTRALRRRSPTPR